MLKKIIAAAGVAAAVAFAPSPPKRITPAIPTITIITKYHHHHHHYHR